MAELVGYPRDEWRLGADHNQVDLERRAQSQQTLDIDRPKWMAVAEARDPGVARRCMELLEPRALGQFPGERVLAAARPHQQDLHHAQCFKAAGARDARLVRRAP